MDGWWGRAMAALVIAVVAVGVVSIAWTRAQERAEVRRRAESAERMRDADDARARAEAARVQQEQMRVAYEKRVAAEVAAAQPVEWDLSALLIRCNDNSVSALAEMRGQVHRFAGIVYDISPVRGRPGVAAFSLVSDPEEQFYFAVVVVDAGVVAPYSMGDIVEVTGQLHDVSSPWHRPVYSCQTIRMLRDN